MHVLESVAPSAVEYLPAAHKVHVPKSAVTAYLPATHVAQVLNAGLTEYLPAAHNVHTGNPEAEVYLPAAHKVQLALPAPEYMPGGHMLTAVAPPVAATTPLTAPPPVTQVAPPSPDWNRDAPAPATNLLKSGETAMPSQYLIPARTLHVAPLFMEKYMLPLETVAASLMKSGEEVIPRHSLLPMVDAAKVTPLSIDM
jgi:hypothetical protein